MSCVSSKATTESPAPEQAGVFNVRLHVLNAGAYLDEVFQVTIAPKLSLKGFDPIQIVLMHRLLADMLIEQFPVGRYHSLLDIERFIHSLILNRDVLPELNI